MVVMDVSEKMASKSPPGEEALASPGLSFSTYTTIRYWMVAGIPSSYHTQLLRYLHYQHTPLIRTDTTLDHSQKAEKVCVREQLPEVRS